MNGQMLISAVLVLVGVVHLLPLIGVLGAARLEQLYQVRIDDPNLLLLMRHRALMFGLLGALLLSSSIRPQWQGLALAGRMGLRSGLCTAGSTGPAPGDTTGVVD